MIVFDTDVISYLLRSRPPTGLVRRVAELDPEEQATTSITVGELVCGAQRSQRPEYFLSRLEELVWPNVRVLPFDRAAGEVYGRLRAALEREGTPVAEPDLRIAATCIRFGALLATGNLRHFAPIPGLEAEDWLEGHR